jgi:hypothetical protein
VFCHVNSWLTGHRLVSLPFSDHCEPLFDAAEDMHFLMRYLQAALEREEWKYLEVRPVKAVLGRSANGSEFAPAAEYYLHTLNLRPALDDVFRSLDMDSVQRRIRRAQRASMVEKCGTSDTLLKQFYRLFIMTRGRHRIPPPPYAWFRNLIACQGDAVEIRVARQNDIPIAAILTLRFKDVVYYKYGCSDERFNKFGAMPWLLWNAIASAKSMGASEFDMGRTEKDNPGLLTFKNHWVPQPRELVYWRFPENSRSLGMAFDWKTRIAKRAFSFMPSGLLTLSGKMLYRHIG